MRHRILTIGREQRTGQPPRHAGDQLLGQRETQEDQFGFIAANELDPAGFHPVAVVADGMGGHAAGEVASGLAVRSFIERYGQDGPVSERLRTALDAANRSLGEAIREDSSLRGMGTTLVAAAVTSDGLHWISVGDSPLYLYRDGQLKRLNEDHSMKPVIDALRDVEPGVARSMSPHQLRSALTGAEVVLVDAPTLPELLKPGDLVVVTTDGLDALDASETATIIDQHKGEGPEATVKALLEAVEQRLLATQDNTTVAIVEVPDPLPGQDQEETS